MGAGTNPAPPARAAQPAHPGAPAAAQRSAVALVVMAKAPVPGLAKTRLIPALGPRGAARLAERFLAQALEAALAAGLGPVTLSAAPDAHHAAFAPWAADARLRLHSQPAGDLGERMASAFEHAFAQAEAVLLFGTDAPALGATRLAEAAAALAGHGEGGATGRHGRHGGHDAVFVPTLDGGYVLIGLTRSAWLRPQAGPSLREALFDGMPWSTALVMPLTRQRLAARHLHTHELTPLPDVDEPADLVHVPATWLEAARHAPPPAAL